LTITDQYAPAATSHEAKFEINGIVVFEIVKIVMENIAMVVGEKIMVMVDRDCGNV
jgi:hypothetical protein